MKRCLSYWIDATIEQQILHPRLRKYRRLMDGTGYVIGCICYRPDKGYDTAEYYWFDVVGSKRVKSKRYPSLELAMKACDKDLIELGYTPLTEEETQRLEILL